LASERLLVLKWRLAAYAAGEASHAAAAFPVFMAMSCCCCISLPPPTACTAQILDIIFALNRREIGLSLKVNESSAQGPNMN